MEKKLKVSGMMCPHCEAHVRKALEGVEGVRSAVPNHEDGMVALQLDKEVSVEALAQAVAKAGYACEGYVG